MNMTAEQSRQTGGYYANQWTVRDEFAARLIAGYVANGAGDDDAAFDAYATADAMLAERRRGSGKELANDIAEVMSQPKRDDLPAHEGEF